MAKLKNFTLDGEALRLIGYKDQNGADLYDLHLADAYDRRGLTREELLAFAMGIIGDVGWGGLLHVCADDFMDETLKAFQKE